jgi:hypothetical protein
MNFKKQLDFGKKYEKKFGELFNKDYLQSDGKTQFDLLINNEKYEVKTDKRAYYTGNFAIEYECNNKPSGINNSEAKYWVFNEIIEYNEKKGDDYDYNFNCFLVPIDDLKKILKEKPIIKVSACENGKNKIYLLNKKYLQEYIINKKKEFTVEELEIMFNNI